MQKVGGDEALYCVPAGHDRQTVLPREGKVRGGQGEQEEEPGVEATVPCSGVCVLMQCEFIASVIRSGPNDVSKRTEEQGVQEELRALLEY